MSNLTKSRIGPEVEVIIFDLFKTLIYINNKQFPYRQLFHQLTDNRFKHRSLTIAALTQEEWSEEDVLDMAECPTQVDYLAFQQRLDLELSSIMAYPETMPVLNELKARGYKLACMSDISQPFQRKVEELPIRRYFDECFYSCEMGLHKHEMAMHREATARLGVKPKKILVVGDNHITDYEMPIYSGKQALWLNRSSQLPTSIRTLSEVVHLLPSKYLSE